MMKLFLGNSNVVELLRLQNTNNGGYIEDATVTVTIVDEDGLEVPIVSGEGVTWPMELDYAGQGNYAATLPELEIEAGTRYTMVMDVDGGEGLLGHWETPVMAGERQ